MKGSTEKPSHEFVIGLSSMRLISVLVVHPYSSIDTATAVKKYCLILLDRSDVHMISNLFIAVNAR